MGRGFVNCWAVGSFGPGSGQGGVWEDWGQSRSCSSHLPPGLVLFFFLFFIFWQHHMACGILVPWDRTHAPCSGRAES